MKSFLMYFSMPHVALRLMFLQRSFYTPWKPCWGPRENTVEIVIYREVKVGQKSVCRSFYSPPPRSWTSSGSWMSAPKCLSLQAFDRRLRSDNKISRQYNFQIQNFIVMTFPTKEKKKTAFWDDFPLCPQGPPLKKRKSIFIVVSPSLIRGPS